MQSRCCIDVRLQNRLFVLDFTPKKKKEKMYANELVTVFGLNLYTAGHVQKVNAVLDVKPTDPFE